MSSAKMSDSFVIPRLGAVTIEDRLVEYDGPLLFTIRAENEGRYVCLLASEEQGESIYWITPVADELYRKLLRGEVEVRSIFVQGDILEVRRDDSTGRYLEPAWKTQAQLDAEALPEAGYRLRATAADEALSAGFVETAQVLAMRLNRAVARFILNYGQGIHEARAKVVAKLILDTQRAVDAIAYAKAEIERPSGFIPLQISDKTILALRPLRASSFAIELVAEEPSDLFHESLAAESLNKLVDILEARSDQAKLREAFNVLPKRALKWYKSLIQDLEESNADVSIETGEPKRQGERRVVLKRQEVPAISAALSAVEASSTNELAFVAELVGYDKDSNWFHIRSLADQQEYRGKATGSSAIEAGQRARIGGHYAVHVFEYVTYDAITEAPLAHYELLDLSEP
jgi:hypothetical protein